MDMDSTSAAEVGLQTEDKLDDVRPGLEKYQTTPFDLADFKAKLVELGITNEQTLLQKSSTTENLLGSGGNASVFAIPGLEGYVLRVPHGVFSENQLAAIEPVEDKFPEMNLGQAVASMGTFTVLKEQRGIPGGVPTGEIRKRGGEEAELVYQYWLEKAASMPQDAYDSLAQLFAFLREHRLNFDPSKANNILLDLDKQVFNVVDLNPTDVGREPVNNLNYMVIPLMDNGYAWQVKNPEREAGLTELRKEILLKSYEAAKKAGLPVPPEDDSSLEYSFKLAGMENQWPQYRSQLISPSTNPTT